ncbi:ImmA/IrrE family metallo-endopeptidase [Pseudomonas sp. MAFF 311095]|uniref:ImmA/IrrE family metallo-endopeptidase n=1 Tax=Pseudomonas petroselini TaxID=2899822 RepID=A0ABS8R3H2_9PSED|nr:ImmA/IrrE family metallo-endopeptidase [Pseudomonas petroselini]MCD7042534.1 ImmA/IrrE family metallo-endopeptidase [Pseudomonas petroselini]MCD7045725.1 ImmA/IrrE family metallo-endopeptidase [Pseudomonas petroselini]MCD7069176.1 ImmA/IrrE family metallo-endopeptidase [Pseudomonas petroselini]MCD7078458.1 ImmA/IrrE family metallo-endopeptidase [Pseudomonas petroselini]
MDETVVVARARKLLRDASVTSAPVDVEALAQSLGFKVSRKDLEDGEAGSTFKRGEKKFIWVNERDSLLRQRFTILHEIAHHVLELPSKHGEKVPADELERFTGRHEEEVLCDIFAAECLVPWGLIQPLAEEKDFSLEHLADLAEQFQASRSCIASRFAQASNGHVAFVVAEDGVVKYSIGSKALRESRVWINRGVPLPQNSAAAKAFRAGIGGLYEADTEGTDWSHSDDARRFACFEQATYHLPTKQTQSILIFDELDHSPVSSGYRAVHDDDGFLEELDGRPGWSKYR